ncbi:hypothetical protein RKD38_000026 [Streptomyces ambofaciens]
MGTATVIMNVCDDVSGDQVATEVTIVEAAWRRLFGAAMLVIADCFVRREPRTTAAQFIEGLLAEVDTRNCRTLAQALGHRGPHRLHHLLSRARFDHDRAREEIARLIIDRLGGQEVVLVADETGDAKSSTDCVGAARQYSGALKGGGLCQVAAGRSLRSRWPSRCEGAPLRPPPPPPLRPPSAALQGGGRPLRARLAARCAAVAGGVSGAASGACSTGVGERER